MTDVNELKARLTELEARKAAILAELAQYRAGLIDNIAGLVIDRDSLVSLVDAINQVTAPFGMMCVVRRLGRRSTADTSDEGGEDETEQSPTGPADLDF